MIRLSIFAGVVLATVAAFAGCQRGLSFPSASLPGPAGSAGYDTDADGRADFFLLAGPGGRADRVGYDRDGDGECDEIVPLDALSIRQCRHLVIVLDGVGYDVVRRFYDAGGLRLFHSPSRVIAPYPSMTDACMEDLFGYMPCRAFKAKYYDRREGRIVGGSLAYLSAANMPYNRFMHYRINAWWAPLFYLHPREFFAAELDDAKRTFDAGRTQEVITYFGSSAGMGTRFGADGQVEVLRGVERFALQVMQETHGLVKVTVFSDHGHGYTPLRRLDLAGALGRKGWRVGDRLERPRDAVLIELGLATYAGFQTNQRAELAADLTSVEGVTLASYADGESVVVLAHGDGAGSPQRAVIRWKAGRYAYEPTHGDPLSLKPILAKLQVDAEGYYDADALLAATADHVWPDPLQRLWRAHFGLVERPDDVIASLEDGRCVGKRSIADALQAESTHGSLNRANSTAFVMSTAGPLPALMRSADLPRHLSALLGRTWPARSSADDP